MSVFDIEDKSEKFIDESFFKEVGFIEGRWGSIRDRKLKTSTVFDKLLRIDFNNIILTYFPQYFTGYTGYHILNPDMPVKMKGYMAIGYDNRKWEDGQTFKGFEINTELDFDLAIGYLLKDLKLKGIKITLKQIKSDEYIRY